MVRKLFHLLLITLFLASCAPGTHQFIPSPDGSFTASPIATNQVEIRPQYNPGDLVDYIAQTGDTLPALAVHFNTTVDKIRQTNPNIPGDATTMPPGMPMKIPIYYLPYWGSQFQIIPDNLFVNGPSSVNFNTETFVASHPGWLKDYHGFVSGQNRDGAKTIDLVALNFSISPQLLLALLEYQAQALSKQEAPGSSYVLGYKDFAHEGLYMQLVWAANILNNGYYGWRSGHIRSFEHPDGRLERPDPWQNAASVAIQSYFVSKQTDEYDLAIGPQGIAKTFTELFGDPWKEMDPHIPASLKQPEFLFPFAKGQSWTFTGGPHSGWGTLEPYSGIDFAPPANIGGCNPTDLWATAVASGVIARSETGIVVLDLDGDMDERTGWDIFYLHTATEGRISKGVQVKAGDPIGYPSCEGGRATGTHIHIARKYRGEWIPADGTLAINLEGWIAHDGERPYLGTLTRGNQIVTACECSNMASRVTAGK
jgi:murein DD-endopeptidase MepM/ murein hydrolase activator NlpD